MRVHQIIWTEDRIDHIARHGVSCDEFEQACFGDPLVYHAKAEGPSPVYYVLGVTDAGRYLFCVVIQFPDGHGFPVTARDMTTKEKRRYKRKKNR